MRIVKWFKLIASDISSVEPFYLWTIWLVASAIVDVSIGTYANSWDNHVTHPKAMTVLYWCFVLESVPIFKWLTNISSPYFKEKWEQTKTSESDEDTLLRGSKEKWNEGF